MRDAIVYSIEIIVGLACAGAGVGTWQRSKAFAVALIGLGAVAVGHALWAWMLR